MSDKLQTALEKLTTAANEITTAMSSAAVANRKEAVEIIFQKIIQEIPMEDFAFLEIIETFKNATGDEQELALMKEFGSLSLQERQITARVMEIVYKTGIVSEEEDLPQRKYWYEKVQAHTQ